MRHHYLLIPCFIAMLAGCLPSSTVEESEERDMTRANTPDATIVKRSPCVPDDEALRSPRSINEAVSLLNVLPRPLDAPCLIEALARPLRIHATRGQISAQPAHGRRSPRIFIFLEPLVLSIVIDGPGSYLLEFGELDDTDSSIKGEVEFPIRDRVSADEPFTHVMFNETKTNCSFCHTNERVAFEVEGTPAHLSTALRPVPRERVSVLDLYTQHITCDAMLEVRRCAILAALFEHGDIMEGYFSEDLSTFY